MECFQEEHGEHNKILARQRATEPEKRLLTQPQGKIIDNAATWGKCL